MKIKTKNKYFFGIVGLPRMGTTITNNLFNSYDNVISLSEPHWYNILNRNKENIKQTYNGINLSENSEVINILKSHLLKNDDLNLIGVKETYRTHQKDSVNFIINNPKVDFIIVVIRNPYDVFNSWLRTGWGGRYKIVENFINDYNDYYNFFKNYQGNTYFIKYEDLCNNSYTYLNKVFKNIFNFDEIKEITKTNYKLGDEKANLGGDIKLYKKDSLLSELDKKLITEGLQKLIKEYNYTI